MPKSELSTDELLYVINDILKDGEYTLKHARSPKKKRAIETSLHFYSSIKIKLELLKEFTK